MRRSRHSPNARVYQHSLRHMGEIEHGRALVGLSAGGYGAVMLALHHLAAFSVVESWSGYFHPTDPAGQHALDLGSSRANANVCSPLPSSTR